MPQYTETVVVHGAAYERFTADRADGPHFAGPWQRLDAGISVPPFAPLAGPRPEAITPQHFVRLAQASVGGIATTMYQLASFGVACPPGTGVATVGHETTWLWVDGQGRVRRWENTSEVQFGSMTLTRHRGGELPRLRPPRERAAPREGDRGRDADQALQPLCRLPGDAGLRRHRRCRLSG